ncbi:hypothetical protein JIX91_01715, partial [Streptococcus pneumoniae]
QKKKKKEERKKEKKKNLNAGNGDMKTGWFQVNGRWYYAYSSGALAVNTTVDGYFVNYNGEWVQ